MGTSLRLTGERRSETDSQREVNADYIDALEMYFLVRNKQGTGAEANTFEIKLRGGLRTESVLERDKSVANILTIFKCVRAIERGFF